MLKIFKRKKTLILLILLVLFLSGALSTFLINLTVKATASKYILTPEEVDFTDADCIIVLGCLVWSETTPSHMLEDRLITGIGLYRQGAAPKLLMSGDHGRKDYDEVNTMKLYAMEEGIPGDDIFMDHAGFSTYESMYRARDVFEAKKVIIVTQSFHLSRAVYIARKLGLEAYGVASDLRSYGTEYRDNKREYLARVKDFFNCIIKPKPKYLGEKIPVSGKGSQTDDK